MDLSHLLSDVDLLNVIGADTQLRRKSRHRRDGDEYAGPCPFCGGVDRFMVWPDHASGRGRWWCRRCDQHGDAVDYLQARGLSFREALRHLGQPLPTGPLGGPGRPETYRDSVAPPAPAWQEQALAHIERCARILWSPAGQKARAYLRQKRGLRDETIQRWQLGYNPRWVAESPEHWGLESWTTAAGKPGRVWVPHGVTIPLRAGGQVWGLKVRIWRRDGQPETAPGRKYSGPRGGAGSLFGADELRSDGRPLLLCEGEFDALLAWQEIGTGGPGLVDVATLAGAGRSIPGRWLLYLLRYERILVAYDLDDAGRAGAARLADLSQRVRCIRVPHGHDLTDFYQAGGDLPAWVRFHLARRDGSFSIGPGGPGRCLTDAPLLVPGEFDCYPVTRCFPPRASVAAIAGQWLRRPTGEVEATYRTPAELALCLALVGCDQPEVWAALEAEEVCG